MKIPRGELGLGLSDDQLRRNLSGLFKFLLFLGGVVALHTVLFQVIMIRVEGEVHSWPTALYWTLTVMSTLGFGDITFQSDVGRAFTIVVLLSGILLLMLVLPFAFIRYFYAPWLEARLRVRAPAAVPRETAGHVILAQWDDIVRALAPRLRAAGVDFVVLEDDAARATELVLDGVPAVRGTRDDVETWRGLGVERARLVVLNRGDLPSTNAALTIREVAPVVPIIALAEKEHSVDILEMSGCNHVFHLKARLGEQLANRVNAGQNRAHRLGTYRAIHVAEFSTHETPFAGRTLAESQLRELAGVNVVGVWERGVLHPPRPDLVLGKRSLVMVVGSSQALTHLDEFLAIYDMNTHPVVVIGGGTVGRAAARALDRRSIPVHMLERDPDVAAKSKEMATRLVVGDAANRSVMTAVGIEEAPSVVISTNHDATNIYLTAYCRRLNPEIHIVSRLTHDRNIVAMHRAGADQALSYSSLAVESIMAVLQERPLVLLGLGVHFRELDCPPGLAGRTLLEAQVGTRTGMTVIGVETADGKLHVDPGPHTVIPPDARLLVIASEEQVARFHEVVGRG